MQNFDTFLLLFTRLNMFFIGLWATCDSFSVKCFFMTFGNYYSLGLFALSPVEMVVMLIDFAYKYIIYVSCKYPLVVCPLILIMVC